MIIDLRAHLQFIEEAYAKHELEYEMWVKNNIPKDMLYLFRKDQDTLKTMIEDIKKELL